MKVLYVVLPFRTCICMEALFCYIYVCVEVLKVHFFFLVTFVYVWKYCMYIVLSHFVYVEVLEVQALTCSLFDHTCVCVGNMHMYIVLSYLCMCGITHMYIVLSYLWVCRSTYMYCTVISMCLRAYWMFAVNLRGIAYSSLAGCILKISFLAAVEEKKGLFRSTHLK